MNIPRISGLTASQPAQDIGIGTSGLHKPDNGTDFLPRLSAAEKGKGPPVELVRESAQVGDPFRSIDAILMLMALDLRTALLPRTTFSIWVNLSGLAREKWQRRSLRVFVHKPQLALKIMTMEMLRTRGRQFFSISLFFSFLFSFPSEIRHK